MQRRRPVAPEWLRTEVGAALLYLGAAFLLTSSAWAAPTTHWIGGCCDPEQTIWFLRWTPHAIANGLNPLFTTFLNAPAGVNLMWNTSTPLWGIATFPASLLGGPILAYNVAIVVAVAGSSWCARLALRRYTTGPVGPLLGGAVYGFSPFVIAHAANHLNLATAWAPPLYLIVLDEILVRRRHGSVRLGVLLGAISAVQLLTAEELLASSVIAAGILVLVLAACRRREIAAGIRRLAPALAAATVTFLLLAGLPLAFQFFGPQRLTGQVSASPDVFSTDLLNLVVPTSYQLLAPQAATQLSSHFSGLTHEATAYLGLPLLMLLTALAARQWADLRLRVAAVMTAVLFVLSLGPSLVVGGATTGWPMPWLPFTWLPLVGNVLPARLTELMWLAIAVFAAVVADEALARPVRLAVPRLAALVAALAIAIPAPLAASSAEVPAFFTRWGQEGLAPGATVMVAPFFRDGAGASPMLWAAVAGTAVRMPEAYAFVPDANGAAAYGPPATQLSSIMETIQDRGLVVVARGAVREQVAQDLRDAAISAVIVGPMDHRDQMTAFFTDLFGRTPDAVDGVLIWRDVDRTGVAPSP